MTSWAIYQDQTILFDAGVDVNMLGALVPEADQSHMGQIHFYVVDRLSLSLSLSLSFSSVHPHTDKSYRVVSPTSTP
ncbi:hypothetical protein ACN38_g1457 [Penicillium nordicum]|uniref:Uncharacterized protein n=1 Tax=Penicillium nordicum TaxID=229535 RepID=A0A0N0RZW0_9EURO|nr:hypothetical protein ACN38_g1457 [Penicillium nordicum]